MSNATRRSVLLGIALVGFVGLGLPDGMLGTAWPFTRADLGRPLEDLGLLITVGTVTGGTMAALSGAVSRRIGSGGLLIVATTATSIGVVMWATAPSFAVFVAGSAIVGLGTGLFDPGINHYVAKHHGARSMNSLHLTFGIGATAGPLVMIGAVEGLGTWRWGLAAILVFYVPMVVIMIVTREGWGRPLPRGERPQRRPPFDRSVLRTVASFAMSTGIEVAGGQWAFTVLQSRGTTDAVAAGFVAAYWGGLTGGRLVGAVGGDRLGRRRTLIVSMVLLVLGYGALWVDPVGLGALGLPVAGAGMALVFPTLVLVTEAVHGDVSDVVMGWSFAGAAAGAAALPWLAGVIGARTEVDVIPLVILISSILFIGILWPLLRAERTRSTVLQSPDG